MTATLPTEAQVEDYRQHVVRTQPQMDELLARYRRHCEDHAIETEFSFEESEAVELDRR